MTTHPTTQTQPQTRPRRGPDPHTHRTGELLDQHLHGLITQRQLTDRLHLQVWTTTWRGTPTTSALDRLHTVLAAELPALTDRVAWYTRVAADATHCNQCRPHQSCPLHLKHLRTYWDHLHAAAAQITHPHPPGSPEVSADARTNGHTDAITTQREPR